MPNDVEGLIEKLDRESLDYICECVGSPKERNDGKSAMRGWFLARLRQHFNAPEGKGEAWQPIATHPKTKEPIWAWVKDTDKNAKHKRSSWSLINYRRDKGAYQFYSTTEHHGALLSQVGLMATHWMPLPAPPGQEQQPPAIKGEIKIHEWKDFPGTKTTPVKCILCKDDAVVVVYAPNGCTCSPNKYQPRCMQHLMRLFDSDEGGFDIIEDFRISLNGEQQPPASESDTAKADITAIFLAAQRAHDSLTPKQFPCKECDGTGRERDDTPCSNPNYAAQCTQCRGKGYWEKQLGLYDRLAAAFDVIRPYLSARAVPEGKE